ncbi:predicted protein [Arabidopsis lyrata subsp. lyrata]|uniref:Predicted protein n=1 Tax=Arabidopsis lyrata subsp. lyrata TaxID=81972 RepID=D7L0T4_ARALL|nr:predicted protein [Arabidopsis lyrata subsp. lyrata]
MNIEFNFEGGLGVAFLAGGGFTITIPPNASMNLTVTAVDGGNTEKRLTGLYNLCGGIEVNVRYRYSIAVHPYGNPLEAGGQFLVHYRTNDVDETGHEDDPVIDLGHLPHG